MKRLIFGFLFLGLLSVQAFAQARMVTPNGGENWARDSRQSIRWEIIGSPENIPVRLVLFFSSGERAGRIDTGLNLNDRSFLWQTGLLDTGTAPAGSYIVRLVRQSDNSLIDASDAPFSISAIITHAPTLRARSFKLLSPNGGEYFRADTRCPIRWDSFGYPGTLIKIFFGSATAFSEPPLAANVPIEMRAFAWLIPKTFFGLYRIKLLSMDGALQDVSERTFKIIPPTEVTLTTPNGGQRYRRGDTIRVRWSYTHPVPEHDQYLSVWLHRYSSLARIWDDTLFIHGAYRAPLLADHECNIPIPGDAPASSFYAIYIRLGSDLYHAHEADVPPGYLASDESQDLFTIE
jgi:hypothetical protein